MTLSQQLLEEYARSGSEAAFGELVTRYIDLVYSTALRIVDRDMNRAEDVAQVVFVDLARLGRKLPKTTMLGGWLHHHTVFVASTVMRGERRRQKREREAVEMNRLQDHTQANLDEVAPILDEVIEALNVEERTAILLRFFEQLDFRAVGEALGSTEEAARKRVTRALEKLEGLLRNRGVSLSATGLGTALATEAVTAAPVGLAATIAGTALSTVTGTGTALMLTTSKVAAMTKLQLGIISAIIVASLSPLIIQHRSQLRIRQDYAALQQQTSEMAAENDRLSNLLAQATDSQTLNAAQQRELLRLRGEVGILRRQFAAGSNEVARAATRRAATSEIEQYYHAHESDFWRKEEVEVSLIVLNKPSPDSPAELGALRNQAAAIHQRLLNTGDFVSEARSHSQGSQAKDGGNWGWVERGMLRKELDDVAFSLQLGQTSELIETPETLFILRVTGRRSPTLKPLSEVQDEIWKILIRQKMAQERTSQDRLGSHPNN